MSAHDCSSSREDQDEQTASRSEEGKTEQCKRKRTQISILEYFSKRKKAKEEAQPKDTEEENMSERQNDTDTTKRRELAASAAEKRLRKNSSEVNSIDETNLDDQEASSSLEVDLSQSLFGASPRDDILAEDDIDNDTIHVSFNKLPHCGEVLPKMHPQPDHTILIRPHIQATESPQPYPDRYRDKWGKEHVRMPCSKENLYPTKEKRIRKRWELIEETLLKPIRSSKDFQDAVMTYNVHYKDRWDFEGWHSFCNHYLSPKEKDTLFHRILPEMVLLVLRLPIICTQPPPLLKRQINRSITISQQQAACLLANAFFCTFPRRNLQKYSEYSTFPDINFNRLFRGAKDVVNRTKAEKLKTLLHYFKRVTTDMPLGTLTFTRQVLDKQSFVDWERCDVTFKQLFVTPKGTIEDDGNGYLQVDFANRLVGGGVIGEGCVQEEIRFLICPELILSRLFVERLDPNETLIVRGAERFSDYTGYAQTYRFKKDFIDVSPRDRWGRLYTEIVAMDAHVFHIYAQQFTPQMLKRELNKAYCAFKSSENPEVLPAVATGNWGCGAFGGDARLKALIQLMSAAVSSRDVVYFTFGDKKLSDDIREFHQFLLEHNVTVGNIWKCLQKYEKELKQRDEHIELYPYLKDVFIDRKEFFINSPFVEQETDEGVSNQGHFMQEDMETEAIGIPCEGANDVSPDYRDETP